jgi:maleate isomerase
VNAALNLIPIHDISGSRDMPDRFGPRGVIAVAIPQQNSNMQPEYESMRPEGVNHQMYRFNIAEQKVVPEAVLSTLPQVAGCWPDIVVCSNSLEMRWWSPERQALYRKETKEAAGGDCPVINATDATVAALKTIGAKKIATISPMTEDMSQSVGAYYGAHGFEVVGATWLEVATSIRIIDVPIKDIVDAFERVAAPDVDTILHVGGALGAVDMLDELEQRLGKNIISSNAATYWYALRMLGIEDKLDRGGRITRMPLADELRTPVLPVA